MKNESKKKYMTKSIMPGVGLVICIVLMCFNIPPIFLIVVGLFLALLLFVVVRALCKGFAIAKYEEVAVGTIVEMKNKDHRYKNLLLSLGVSYKDKNGVDRVGKTGHLFSKGAYGGLIEIGQTVKIGVSVDGKELALLRDIVVISKI